MTDPCNKDNIEHTSVSKHTLERNLGDDVKFETFFHDWCTLRQILRTVTARVIKYTSSKSYL